MLWHFHKTAEVGSQPTTEFLTHFPILQGFLQPQTWNDKRTKQALSHPAFIMLEVLHETEGKMKKKGQISFAGH